VIGSAIVRALFLLQDNPMVVFLSVAATMLAFAGNSVLTRLALAEMAIDAGNFALLCLASGAVILLALTAQQNRLKDFLGPNRVGGMLALSLYMIGFSYAYTKLDTGGGRWFYLVLSKLRCLVLLSLPRRGCRCIVCSVL